MWCKNCRQDVPAVSCVGDNCPSCLRCGADFPHTARTGNRPAVTQARARLAATRVQKKSPVEDTSFVCDAPVHSIRAPLSTFDTWELAEQLRHVDRILSGTRFATTCATPAVAETTPPPSPTPRTETRRGTARSHAAWAIVAIGAVALACGIILLCAGTFIAGPDWQSLGLPITLLGQVALLLGMMLQLDLVWQGKRDTASKLYRFQKRLVDLEALANELSPATPDAEPTPNAELELVAELKSRLDVLSHRLNSPCG